MTDGVLLGLDLGTSSSKLIAFDARGTVLGSAARGYQVHAPAPGRFELDADEVWQAAAACLREIAAAPFARAIVALSLSVQGEAIVPVDRTGRCLAGAPISLDRRAGTEATELVARIGTTRLCALTGQPTSTLPPLPRLMWWRRHAPELHEAAWKYLGFGELVLLRLGLEPAIDQTMAARTLAFDVSAGRFSEEILDAAGINADKLPDIRPAGTVLGHIGHAVAHELGLPDGITVVQGGHDQPMGALGGGVAAPGQALYSIGTTEAIVAVVPSFEATLPQRGIPCYPHVVPGRFVALVGSQSGGRALSWFRRTFAITGVPADADWFDVLALAEDAEPQGPMILPHFAGSGSVLADEGAAGAVVGLRFEHGPGDILRALLEGISYEQAIGVAALAEAGLAPEELRAVGGGARSPFWLRMKADIFGRRVGRAATVDGPCLGAALMAGYGIGIHPWLEAAAAAMPIADWYEPRPSHHAAHRRRLATYMGLYRALRPFGAALAFDDRAATRA